GFARRRLDGAMRTRTLALVMGLAVAGCSTVTVRPQGGPRLETPPTHEERVSFFLGGLVGEGNIDVRAVCGGKNAEQLQTQDQFVDRLLGGVTYGIYTPRTARVWCER